MLRQRFKEPPARSKPRHSGHLHLGGGLKNLSCHPVHKGWLAKIVVGDYMERIRMTLWHLCKQLWR